MKIHRIVVVLSLAGAVSTASAGTFSVEPGYSHVRVSGIRPYAAKQNLSQNLTRHVDTPTLRLAFNPVDPWSFGIGYTDYRRFLGRGISANGDIYNEGGPSIQTLIPVESSERVRELALDARYRLKVGNSLDLEAGPVLSWFKSRAEIWPVYPSVSLVAGHHFPGRFYSASELNLGALAGLRWKIASRWSLSGDYRYAAPKDRTLSIFTASVGYAF